jgi:uncharacterized protein (TIGR03067 family)
MNAAECPQRERLSAYLLGDLPEDEMDNLVRHVEVCPDCETAIEALESGSDTLIGKIRQPPPVDPFAGEPECNEALSKAAKIGGTDRSTESRPPRSLGQYQLLEKLGQGGMGTVYKARHEKLDRIVALKVLQKHRMVDQQAVARFEREMKAVGSLEHPNIVRATDAGEVDDVPYLVMEYVDGWDLAALLRRLGPLPVADACEIVRQAAVALQAAHERGLVHRDVKPSNLMLDRQGGVRLLDLGLARFQLTSTPGECSSQEEMTGTGQVMGTADYMAPEQFDDSHTADIRADIYALGCTLYKLLSGRQPFAGEAYGGPLEKMNAHAQETVPSIRQFRKDVPGALADVIERTLAKDPAGRFQVPEELAEALKPFCEKSDLAELARREPDYPPTPKPIPQSVGGRGGRFWAVIVGLMLFAGGFGVAMGILLTIEHNGRTTTVEVPDESNVTVGANGAVNVKLPGGGNSAATAAAGNSDATAILGTWEVVSSSSRLFEQVDRGPYTRTSGKPLLQRLVITQDALKIQGENGVDESFTYRLNPATDPKMIDLESGGRIAAGIYRFKDGQLHICVARHPNRIGGPGQTTPLERPREFWDDPGSNKDLLVLKRTAAATIEADEKTIQGTWKVVGATGDIAGMSVNVLSATSGLDLEAEDIIIGRHKIHFKVPIVTFAHGGYGEYGDPGGGYGDPGGGMFGHPLDDVDGHPDDDADDGDMSEGMGGGDMSGGMDGEFDEDKDPGAGDFGAPPPPPAQRFSSRMCGYALDPSKTPKQIDFVGAQRRPVLGLYEFQGDNRLTIYLGISQRPKGIGDDSSPEYVRIDLERVWVVPTFTDSTYDTTSEADSHDGAHDSSDHAHSGPALPIRTLNPIEKALDKKTSFKFNDAPLSDVVDYLKKAHKIQISISKRHLDDIGMDVDTPVTCDIKDISLRSALRLVLREFDLSYVVLDEVLLITSADDADTRMGSSVYQVRSLFPTTGVGDYNFRQLRPLLAATVHPDTWAQVGGEGSHAIISRGTTEALSVRQTSEVREDIGELLDRLAGKETTLQRAEKVLLKALDTKTELEFIDTPLADVVDFLQKKHGIQIQIDRKSLDDIDLDIDTPVTRNLRDVSLRSALRLMLDELGLTYIIIDEVLLFTTADAVVEYPCATVHDVTDLVSKSKIPGDGSIDYESFIKALTDSVEPQSWADVGAVGVISPLTVGDRKVLVIWHERTVHEKIAEFLDKLRGPTRPTGDAGHDDPVGSNY